MESGSAKACPEDRSMVVTASATVRNTSPHERLSQKRQRTAALQDASAFSKAIVGPQGFGVRLSSAALALMSSSQVAVEENNCAQNRQSNATLALWVQAWPNLTLSVTA